MMPVPPLVAVALLAAIVLGLPIGLYLLLTRGQRRNTRLLRARAVEQGWRYRRRRWQGNPIAFRIDGQSPAGLSWILTAGNTRGYDPGWCVAINLVFPALGGAADIAIEPRGTAAGLLQDSREVATGDTAFDAAYRVLVSGPPPARPPVDSALAARILDWPVDAVALHSMLVWRDAFGLHLQARLPATPNWPVVSYWLSLAEELIARIPPPTPAAAPPGIVDRLAARLPGA